MVNPDQEVKEHVLLDRRMLQENLWDTFQEQYNDICHFPNVLLSGAQASIEFVLFTVLGGRGY